MNQDIKMPAESTDPQSMARQEAWQVYRMAKLTTATQLLWKISDIVECIEPETDCNAVKALAESIVILSEVS